MNENSAADADVVPTVSWLIPVYNGEEFLREALDSVFAQTFTDFEVILVNDGSTDGTRELCEEFQRRDKRLKVIHQSNGGIVSALNTGIAHCRGQYIARLDADDIALPNRLQMQVEYLENHPGCVLVGGYAIGIGRDCDGVGKTTGGRHLRTDLEVFPPKVAVAMHPLITVRKSAMQAVKGYRSDYPHAEDYDLFLRLSELGTIDNPPVDVLMYRRHDNAISIRNAELQERSAAVAERDAIARTCMSGIPDPLFEDYVNMRIFRRFSQIDRTKARAMLPQMRAALLRLSPSALFDKRYLRLRAIIAANLLRYARRSFRSAVADKPAR